MGPYVVDFYCAALRLAIELDGESHFEESAVIYDAMRQEYIESLGIKVLRFTNDEVKENLQGVIEFITRHMQSDPPEN